VRELSKHGSVRGERQLRYGRNIVAPPRNQAETEKTNLDLSFGRNPSTRQITLIFGLRSSQSASTTRPSDGFNRLANPTHSYCRNPLKPMRHQMRRALAC